MVFFVGLLFFFVVVTWLRAGTYIYITQAPTHPLLLLLFRTARQGGGPGVLLLLFVCFFFVFCLCVCGPFWVGLSRWVGWCCCLHPVPHPNILYPQKGEGSHTLPFLFLPLPYAMGLSPPLPPTHKTHILILHSPFPKPIHPPTLLVFLVCLAPLFGWAEPSLRVRLYRKSLSSYSYTAAVTVSSPPASGQPCGLHGWMCVASLLSFSTHYALPVSSSPSS